MVVKFQIKLLEDGFAVTSDDRYRLPDSYWPSLLDELRRRFARRLIREPWGLPQPMYIYYTTESNLQKAVEEFLKIRGIDV